MRGEVLLVRHCESSGQEPDAPLTPRGRAQAVQLDRALRDCNLAGLISSPYRRARESASDLVERTGLGLTIDDRLREWETPWIPQEEWPDALRPILGGAMRLPPGFESVEEARARGAAAAREALARDGVQLLLGHGKLIALILSELDGRDAFEQFVRLHNPHVFAVIASPAGVEARSLWHPA